LGRQLKDRRKRESFAIYACGILAEGERKSVEPIAARASGDPDQTRHMHDKLLHFVGLSQWSDAAVRLEAARHVCEALTEKEPVTTWVIHDTGFLKQGRHSVGVQRQYTGSAGKITNCQVGVSLAIASATAPAHAHAMALAHARTLALALPQALPLPLTLPPKGAEFSAVVLRASRISPLI
jgi:SRSO17 transposase